MGLHQLKTRNYGTKIYLMAIGRLTRAGGSFATFTVASAVRQRLAEAGFEFEKRPGFGRKRDMLVGRKRAGALAPQPTRKIGKSQSLAVASLGLRWRRGLLRGA